MYENFVKLYNSLLSVHFKEWNNPIDVKKDMDGKHDPSNVFIKGLKYHNGTISIKKKVGNFCWKSKSR